IPLPRLACLEDDRHRAAGLWREGGGPHLLIVGHPGVLSSDCWARFCGHLAGALPAISDSLSATLWREQTYPQTQAGRTIMKWILGIGLGGAGIAGATLGTS